MDAFPDWTQLGYSCSHQSHMAPRVQLYDNATAVLPVLHPMYYTIHIHTSTCRQTCQRTSI